VIVVRPTEPLLTGIRNQRVHRPFHRSSEKHNVRHRAHVPAVRVSSAGSKNAKTLSKMLAFSSATAILQLGFAEMRDTSPCKWDGYALMLGMSGIQRYGAGERRNQPLQSGTSLSPDHTGRGAAVCDRCKRVGCLSNRRCWHAPLPCKAGPNPTFEDVTRSCKFPAFRICRVHSLEERRVVTTALQDQRLGCLVTCRLRCSCPSSCVRGLHQQRHLSILRVSTASLPWPTLQLLPTLRRLLLATPL